METIGTLNRMDLPNENLSSDTFRRVRFNDLVIGEYYFIKSLADGKDKYAMITDKNGDRVTYTVSQQRNSGLGEWDNFEEDGEATRLQVNAANANAGRVHFYEELLDFNNNGANEFMPIDPASQAAILASIPRPLRPGQRLLLNVEARNRLPAFRVVTRNRRRGKKPTQRRKRRST